jgi:hypothetical protein
MSGRRQFCKKKLSVEELAKAMALKESFFAVFVGLILFRIKRKGKKKELLGKPGENRNR